MKVVAMGYTGTGSSALVHLLKEYSNCFDIDSRNYEHNLFYAPHGLFDLEDVLLGNNSFYKSDSAINDFYTQMKNLNDNDYEWFGGYKNRYGKQFMKIVDDFIDGIITYTRTGGWSNDYRYKFNIFNVPKDIIKLVIGKRVVKFGYRVDNKGHDNKVNYAFPNPDEFYEKGKQFINNYFEMIGYDKSKVYVFDQIIEPQQLYRINRYFDNDIKFIVFDRDPRDIYLRYKYIWSIEHPYYLMPDNINDFIKFYLRMYQTEKKIEDDRIMRVHFEDLIYKYDETVEQIESFIGDKLLGEHIYKKQYFDPEISIKNTQMYNIDPNWKEEVSEIKHSNLKDKLYNFPYDVFPKIFEVTDPNPNTKARS